MGNSVKFHQTSFQVGSTSAEAQDNYRDGWDKIDWSKKDAEQCRHGITLAYCAPCKREAKKRPTE